MKRAAQYRPAKWRYAFWKLLYPIYYSNSSVGRLINNKITPIGYLIIGGLFLSVALRAGMYVNELFALISVLFSLLIISASITWMRRPKIRIERSSQRLVTEGQQFCYYVRVYNLGKRSLTGLKLREFSGEIRPELRAFVYSVEPGEEYRNAFDKLFVYYRWQWLIGRKASFYSFDSTALSVEAGDSEIVEVYMEATRRGLLKLAEMRAILPDPFHIFQRCANVEQDEDTIVVLPRRYWLPKLLLLGDSRNQIGGEAQSRQLGDSSEFVSMRDYRAGDPLRHVDWKSWARTGKPVVREYEDVYYPRYGLVMDTLMRPELFREFEECVSIASSFTCAIDTRESVLDLVVFHQQAEVLSVGKGLADIDKMLEFIACAEMDNNGQWKSIDQELAKLGDLLSSCIFVMGDWCEDRASTVRKCIQRGIPVLLLIVTDDEKVTGELIKTYSVATKPNLISLDRVQESLSKIRP